MLRKIATFLSVAALSAGVVGLGATGAKAFTDAELSFLNRVWVNVANSPYADTLPAFTNANLLGIAYTTCEILNTGAPLTEVNDIVINRINNSSVSTYSQYAVTYIIGYTMGAGIYHFCPQHTYQLTSNTEQRSSTSYTPSTTSTTSTNSGYWGILTATDPDSQINVRSTPSLNASAPHYGLVGDRVWITRSEQQSDGYIWHFVGFPETNVTGWIRADFVNFD